MPRRPSSSSSSTPAAPRLVGPLLYENDGLRVAVPVYSLGREHAAQLARARAAVPAAPLDARAVEHLGLESLALRAFGGTGGGTQQPQQPPGPRLRPLTPALARRLAGRTVPGMSGQRWMDLPGAPRAERAAMLELHTVHGAFDVERSRGGLFFFRQRAQHRAYVLTSWDAATGAAHTWEAYEFPKGRVGTGSGADPVFVWA